MDKAKEAITSFLHKDGKHDTTVHETVNPSITNEHVTRKHHENVTTAVDREIHQDHHHTSVQPITHREVLPEKHTHNIAGTEHKEFHHGDHSNIEQKLEAEAAKFKSTREVGDTQHTSSALPTAGGQHVHHHVHETIQPVIQKETIQPSVVHTTIPVHEVHHNEAKHHTTTALPAMTMSEFEKHNGSLTGRETRHDAFAGEPRTVGSPMGSTGTSGTSTTHGTTHGTTNGNTSAVSGNSTGHSTGTKPSMMDKLNPKVDADGDGKAGLMD